MDKEDSSIFIFVYSILHLLYYFRFFIIFPISDNQTLYGHSVISKINYRLPNFQFYILFL